MNDRVRRVARRLLPRVAANRAIEYERYFRERHGVPEVAAKVSSTLGDEVLAGPFVGLRLGDQFESEIASPVLKLVGLYEPQLHPALEEAITAEPKIVVNVGCADGYYAVGLARRLPTAQVHAFDLARRARSATTLLAVRNGVAGRVRVRGRCRGFPADTGLVVCDIEGSEADLLRAPLPLRAFLIVETHDHVRPGVTGSLAQLFEATHDVEHLEQLHVEHPPSLGWLTADERRIVMSEMRGVAGQRWLVMRPKHHVSRD